MSKVTPFPVLQREPNRQFAEETVRVLQDHAASINELYDLRWDDLRFPAQGINPAGSVAPPGVNTTDGLLDFDAAGTELIGGVAQMPHAWAESTPIRPHIHLLYRNAAAGNSVWQFEYKIANVNGDFPASYTSETKTHTGPASAVRHAIFAFSEISMVGYKDSCCILWRLSRLGGNGADTFAHDVALIEFDIHYQSDGRGSAQEYPS